MPIIPKQFEGVTVKIRLDTEEFDKQLAEAQARLAAFKADAIAAGFVVESEVEDGHEAS